MIRTVDEIRYKLEEMGWHIGNWSYDILYGKTAREDPSRRTYVESFNLYFQLSIYLIYSFFFFGMIEKGVSDVIQVFFPINRQMYYYSFSRHGLILITSGSIFLALRGIIPDSQSENSIFSEKWFEEGADLRIHAVIIIGSGLIAVGAILQLLGTIPTANENESPLILMVSVISLFAIYSLYLEAIGYEDEDIFKPIRAWITTELDVRAAMYYGARNVLSKAGLILVFLVASLDIFGSALLFRNSEFTAINQIINYLIETQNPIVVTLISILLLLLSIYFLSVTIEAFTDPWNPPTIVIAKSIFEVHPKKYARIITGLVGVFVYQTLSLILSTAFLLFVMDRLFPEGSLTAAVFLLFIIFFITYIIPSGLFLVPYSVAAFDIDLLTAFFYSWELSYGYKRTIFFVYMLSIGVGAFFVLLLFLVLIPISLISSKVYDFLSLYALHAYFIFILSAFADIFFQLHDLPE